MGIDPGRREPQYSAQAPAETTTMQIQKVLLVGGGNMGRALAEGWLRRAVAAEIEVVEPATAARAALRSELRCVSSPADISSAGTFDAIVFAVKPQLLAEIAGQYGRFNAPRTVFVSIAAGRSLEFLAERLGSDAALVRAMPNTPAAIGQGMTVLCANHAADQAHREVAATLLGSVGEVAWVRDEQLMDAVTAVSGSGPAYVFLMIESLAAAGVAVGLPEALALQLARTTVAGAGQLAVSSQASPAELRRQVTSPGGTTEAALAVLMQDQQLGQLLRRAVEAAKARSEELRSGQA